MPEHRVDHGTFTIERTYATSPDRVFAAWASQTEKDRWFGTGDDFLTETDEYSLDFRVGGDERLAGALPNGRRFSYVASYLDVVQNARIVAAYSVSIDDRRTSVSLMTVQLSGTQTETRLTLTEQGAFLDRLDSNDGRIEGARDSLEKLAQHLQAVAADTGPADS